MKVLLIILGVLFLIGCIPVGVRFRYHEEIELKLIVLFFKIGILPKKPLSRKKREKAEAKKAKKKKQQAQSLIAKPPAPKPEKPKPKKPLSDKIGQLIPWAKLGARFVGEFFHRKLAVKRLRIRAVLAGGDPAKTAQSVGKAWETIGIALPILERAFRIKERRIVVYPDFNASKTDLEAELELRLRIGGVVLLVLKFGCKAVALLFRQKRAAKKQKTEAPTPEAENEIEKVG